MDADVDSPSGPSPAAATVPAAAAVPAAAPVPDAAAPTEVSVQRRPLLFGYLVTLGAVGAVVTGIALYGLRSIIFSVVIAIFATVGLDPLVRFFERRHMSRPWAIVTVILLIIAVLVMIIGVVLPLAIQQISFLARAIPDEIGRLKDQGWFDPANASSNGALGALVNWIAQEVKNPAVWASLGSGAVGFAVSVVNGVTTGIFITILTIYFIATYDATKNAAYRLVAASHRATVVSYTERILVNFGKYLSGMVILAFCNAVYSLILLLATGVPGAFLIALLAFFITLIPLIGTVLTTAVMTVLAFIHAPLSGLLVLIFMLIYMQVEAYVLTPKVMGKAVQVPGSVVLISALAGATLFGLPGALFAIPVSAGIILIITGIVMPRKERT